MLNVSLNFRQAAYAQETGRVIIALFTIDHESLSEPIRLSSDPTQRLDEYSTDQDIVYGTVSRGEKYIFYPMRLKLPDETDEGMGEITIEIDNVHRTLMETIRNIFTPPAVNTEIVMDNTPDVVEAQWPEFLLTNINYNASVISGTLRADMLEKEPFPMGTFNPSYFPSVF